MSATNRSERIATGETDYGRVKDPGFAQRIQRALDANPEIPPPHYGRLSWMVRQFKNKFDVTLTAETVRKWTEGLSIPRLERRAQLAEILGVDQGWLIVGSEVSLDQKTRKLRNAEVDGAVNLIAGLVQMDGGNPAFPGSTDRDSARDGVDLYAVIRGAHYAFNVTTAVPEKDGSWRIPVPAKREQLVVLAVVRTAPFAFDILEVDEDAIAEHGKFSSGTVSLPLRHEDGVYMVGDLGLKQVQSFGDRL